MPLSAGTYEFGPNESDDEGLGIGEPSSVSFGLEVRPDGECVLSPGRLLVSVEGQKVSSPISVTSGQTIQAGADHFVVLPPAAATGSNRRVLAPTTPIAIAAVNPVPPPRGGFLLALALLLIVLGVVLGITVDDLWYLLAGVGIVLGIFTWLRRGRLGRAAQHKREVDLRNAKSELASALMDRRFAVAQERRSQIVGPAELLSTDALSAPTLLAVGAGDTEWSPKVGRSESLGWDPHPTIEDYSSVSSVPFQLDTGRGPIAIAGSRSDTRAVARYLTVAAMHQFGPDAVSISTDDTSAWEWADGHVSRSASEFTIVDRADVGSIATGSMPARGAILIDTDEQLPDGVDRVLRVSTTSVAHAVDDQARLLAADLVPYGLTVAAAQSAAASVIAQHASNPAMRAAAEERLKNIDRPAPTPPLPSTVPLPTSPPMPKTPTGGLGRQSLANTDAMGISPAAAEPNSGATGGAAVGGALAGGAVVGGAAAAAALSSTTGEATESRSSIETTIDAEGGVDIADEHGSGLDPREIDPKELDPSALDDSSLDDTSLDSGALVRTESSTASSEPDMSAPSHVSAGDATVLFTVDSAEVGRELVASVAIDMAHRKSPSAASVCVIDSKERGLIRLRQLPHCVGYAAIDDRPGLDRVLTTIENHNRAAARAGGSPTTMTVVISDLGPLLDFLRRAERDVDINRLINAAATSSSHALVVAAATSASAPVDPAFDACVTSRVRHESSGQARISDGQGERDLPTADFSASDLTGAVAAIKREALRASSSRIGETT